ncbi:MAG: PDDEXK nuclease domain-containing protein [Rhodothermales bacterium]
MTLPTSHLLNEIRTLIEGTRERVATTVNAELTLLYWQIGDLIRRDLEAQNPGDGGEQSLRALSQQLTADYGRGYSKSNLAYFVQFARLFPDPEVVHALRGQLSWTHFRTLLSLDDDLKRDFYAEMARIERWSTRQLQERIGSMLYERTALSRKPDVLIREELDALRDEDRLTPALVFRDPYMLDFLGLQDRYLERDLEDAILREIEAFLLELGVGFTFAARQKRITVDGDDYYLDLLFFHRGLRRLVAVELKLGAFKPADKGQMELYLRWLDRYERQPGEGPPLGLILCAGKKAETVELLALGEAGIHVAEYLTELPPRDLLEARLHEAIATARARTLPAPNDDR